MSWRRLSGNDAQNVDGALAKPGSVRSSKITDDLVVEDLGIQGGLTVGSRRAVDSHGNWVGDRDGLKGQKGEKGAGLHNRLVPISLGDFSLTGLEPGDSCYISEYKDVAFYDGVIMKYMRGNPVFALQCSMSPSSGMLKIGDVVSFFLSGPHPFLLPKIAHANVSKVDGAPVDISGSFVNNNDGTYSFTYAVDQTHKSVDSAQLATEFVMTDATGALSVKLTHVNNSVSVDADPPRPTSITISPSDWCKVGDLLTLTLEANRRLSEPPALKILNRYVDDVTGSGKTWTATQTVVDEDEEGVVEVDIESMVSESGNVMTVSPDLAFLERPRLDKVPPTISSMHTSLPDPTNADYVSVDVTFSEFVTGLTADPGKYDAVGCSVQSVTGSGSSYTVTASMHTEGDVVLRIKDGAVVDRAKNGLQSTSFFKIVRDTQKPISAITKRSPFESVNNMSSLPFRVTFNENVFGSTSVDGLLRLVQTVHAGTELRYGTFAKVSDNAYEVDILSDAYSKVAAFVEIKDSAVYDLAGNPNLNSASIGFLVDRVPPTTSLMSDRYRYSVDPEFVLTSSKPADLDSSLLSVSNGQLYGIQAVGDAQFSFKVRNMSVGEVTVVAEAGCVTDAVSNACEAVSTMTVLYNNVPGNSTFLPDRQTNGLPGFYSSSFGCHLVFERPMETLGLTGSGCSVGPWSGSLTSFSFQVYPSSDLFQVSLIDTRDHYYNIIHNSMGPLGFSTTPASVTIYSPLQPNAIEGHFSAPYTAYIQASYLLSKIGFLGSGCSVVLTSDISTQMTALVTPLSSSFSFELTDTFDRYGLRTEAGSGPLLYNNTKAQLELYLPATGLSNYFNGAFVAKINSTIMLSDFAADKVSATNCVVSNRPSSYTSYYLNVSPTDSTFSFVVKDVHDIYGNRCDDLATGDLYASTLASVLTFESEVPPNTISGFYNGPFQAKINYTIKLLTFRLETTYCSVSNLTSEMSYYAFTVTPTASPFSIRTSDDTMDIYGNACYVQSPDLHFSTVGAVIDITVAQQTYAHPGRFNAPVHVNASASFQLSSVGVQDTLNCSASMLTSNATKTSMSFIAYPSSDGDFSFGLTGYDRYGNPFTKRSQTLQYKAMGPVVTLLYPKQPNAWEYRYNSPFVLTFMAEDILHHLNFDAFGCSAGAPNPASNAASYTLSISPNSPSFSLLASGYDTYGNAVQLRSATMEYDVLPPQVSFREDRQENADPGFYSSSFDAHLDSQKYLYAKPDFDCSGCSVSTATGSLDRFSFRVHPSQPSFGYSLKDTFDTFGNLVTGGPVLLNYSDAVPIAAINLNRQINGFEGYYSAPFEAVISSTPPLNMEFGDANMTATGCSLSRLLSQSRFTVYPDSPSFSVSFLGYDKFGKTAQTSTGPLAFSDVKASASINLYAGNNARHGYYNSDLTGRVLELGRAFYGVNVSGDGCQVTMISGGSWSFTGKPISSSFSLYLVDSYDAYGNAMDSTVGPFQYMNQPRTTTLSSTPQPNARPGHYSSSFRAFAHNPDSFHTILVSGTGCTVTSPEGDSTSYSFWVNPFAPSFIYELRSTYDLYGNLLEASSGNLVYRGTSAQAHVIAEEQTYALPGYYSSPFSNTISTDIPLNIRPNFESSSCSIQEFTGSGTSYAFVVLPQGPLLTYSFVAYDVYGNRVSYNSAEYRYDESPASVAFENTPGPNADVGYYNSPFTGVANFQRRMTKIDMEGVGCVIAGSQTSYSTFSFTVTPTSHSFEYALKDTYDLYGVLTPGNFQGLKYNSVSPTVSFDRASQPNGQPGYYRQAFQVTLTSGATLRTVSIGTSGCSVVMSSSYAFDVQPSSPHFSFFLKDTYDKFGNPVPLQSDALLFENSEKNYSLHVPTQENATTGKFRAPFVATIALSANIMSLTTSNMDASGCSITNIVGSGSSFSFSVTPTSGTFSFRPLRIYDYYGNPVTGPDSGTMLYNDTAAIVSLAGPDPSGIYTGPFECRVNANDALQGMNIDRLTASGCSVHTLTGSGSSYSFVVVPSFVTFSVTLNNIFDTYGHPLSAETGQLQYLTEPATVSFVNPDVPNGLPGYYRSPFVAYMQSNRGILPNFSFEASNCSVTVSFASNDRTSFTLSVEPNADQFGYSLTGATDVYGLSANASAGPFRYSLASASLTVNPDIVGLAGYYNAPFGTTLSSDLLLSDVYGLDGTGCSVQRTVNPYSFLVTPTEFMFSYSIRAYDAYGNDRRVDSGNLYYNNVPASVDFSNDVQPNGIPGYYRESFQAFISTQSLMKVFGPENIRASGCSVTDLTGSLTSFSMRVTPLTDPFSYSVTSAIDKYGNTVEASGPLLRYNAVPPEFTLENGEQSNSMTGYYNAPFYVRVTSLSEFGNVKMDASGCSVTFNLENRTTSFSALVTPQASTFAYSVHGNDNYGNPMSENSQLLRYLYRQNDVTFSPSHSPYSANQYFNGSHGVDASCVTPLYSALQVSGTNCVVEVSGSSASYLLTVTPTGSPFSYLVNDTYDIYGNVTAGQAGPFYYDNTPPVIELNNETGPNAQPGYYRQVFNARLDTDTPMYSLSVSATNCAIGSITKYSELSYGFTVTPSVPGSFSYCLKDSYDVYGNVAFSRSPDLYFRNAPPPINFVNLQGPNSIASYFNGSFTAYLASSETMYSISASKFTGAGCTIDGLVSTSFTVSPVLDTFSYGLSDIYDVYGNNVSVYSPTLYYRATASASRFVNPVQSPALETYYRSPYTAFLLTGNTPLYSFQMSDVQTSGCSVTSVSQLNGSWALQVTPTTSAFSYALKTVYDAYGNLIGADSGPLYFSPSLTAQVTSPGQTTFTNNVTSFNLVYGNRIVTGGSIRPQPGLISRCRFDSSNVADDYTTSFAITAGTASLVPGKVGIKAVAFDLSYSSRVNAWVTPSSRSVSAWIFDYNIRDTKGGGYACVMIAQGNNRGATDFYLMKNQNVSSYYVQYNMPNTSNWYALGSKTSTVTGTSNKWQHHCITYDGAGAMNYYLDGTLKASVADAVFQTTSPGEVLGAAGSGQFAHVAIDDYRVFNRVLSVQEIQSLASGNAATVTSFASVNQNVYSFKIDGLINNQYSVTLECPPNSATDEYGNTNAGSTFTFQPTDKTVIQFYNDTQENGLPGYYSGSFRALASISGSLQAPISSADFVTVGCSVASIDYSTGSVTFTVTPNASNFRYSIEGVQDVNGNYASASGALLSYLKNSVTNLVLDKEAGINALEGYYKGPLEISVICPTGPLTNPTADSFTASGCNFSNFEGGLTSGSYVYTATVTPSEDTFSFSGKATLFDAYGNPTSLDSGTLRYSSVAPTIQFDWPKDPNALDSYVKSAFEVTAKTTKELFQRSIVNVGCSVSPITGSGSYLFTVYPASSTFSFTFSAYDAYGNSGSADSGTMRYNNVAPTYSLSLGALANSQPGYYRSSFEATLIVSDVGVSVSHGNIIATNCSVGPLSGSYDWEVFPFASPFSFDLVAYDAFGNKATASAGSYAGTPLNYSDKTASGAIINNNQSNGSVGYYSGPFVGTLSVSDGDIPDFSLNRFDAFGCSLTLLTNVGTIYTFTVNPESAIFSYKLRDGTYDYYGNAVSASSGLLLYNTTAPSAYFSNPTNQEAQAGYYNGVVGAQLSTTGALTALSSDNFVTLGCSIGPVTKDGLLVYTFNVYPSASSFRYSLGNAYDLYGNAVTASSPVLLYNSIAPTITFSNPTNSNATDGYYNSAIDAALTPSAPLKGLALNNIAASGCSVRDLAPSGDKYTFRVIPTEPLFSYRLNGVYDLFGNAVDAGAPTLRYDTTAPVIALENPTNANAIDGYYNSVFRAVLSSDKTLKPLVTSNVVGTNCNISGLALSDGKYVFDVAPANQPTFSYALNGVYDLYGNLASAATSTLRYNRTPPSVVLSNPTNAEADAGYYNGPISATMTPSADLKETYVTNFVPEGCSITGLQPSGLGYAYTVTPSASTFRYSLSELYDLYGNLVGPTSTGNLLYNTAGPVLTFQNMTNSLASAGYFNAAFTGNMFTTATLKSLSVSNFTGNYCSLTTLVSYGLSYGYQVSPFGAAFSYSVEAFDRYGNKTGASTTAFVYDPVAPVVTYCSIASSSKYVNTASPIPWRVDFSEPIYNFSTSQLTIENGTAGTVTAGNDNKRFDFNLTPVIVPGADSTAISTANSLANYTFVACFKIPDATPNDWGRVLDFNSGTANWLLVTVKSPTNTLWGVSINSASTFFNTAYTFTANTQYIVTVYFAPSASSYKFTLYSYDGTSVSQLFSNSLTTASPIQTSLANLYLGKSAYSSDSYFKGSYQKVALYNGDLALSASRLIHLKGLLDSSPPNAYTASTYRFNCYNPFHSVTVGLFQGPTCTENEVTLSGVLSTADHLVLQTFWPVSSVSVNVSVPSNTTFVDLAGNRATAVTGEPAFVDTVAPALASNGCAESVDPVGAPNTISGLMNWYDATRGVTITSGKVSQWNDMSGNNRHAKQTNSSYRPWLKNDVYGNPAISFNTASNYVNGGQHMSLTMNQNNLTGITIAMVYTPYGKMLSQHFSCNATGWTTGDVHINSVEYLGFGANNGDNGYASYYEVKDNVPVLLIFALDMTNKLSFASTNGVKSSRSHTGTGTLCSTSSAMLGNYDNLQRTLYGSISEFIVYNRYLTVAEHEKLEGYLTRKWWNAGINPLSQSHKYYYPPITSLYPIPWKMSFSEPISNFSSAGLFVTVTNASPLQGFTTSNGRDYSFDLFPAGPGNVTVSIPSGSLLKDNANNSIVAMSSPAVTNNSFESPVLTSFAYRPTTDFTGYAGIGKSGVIWAPATTDGGSQYLFLQSVYASHGSYTTSITGLVAGRQYIMRFKMVKRTGTGNNNLKISLNGTLIFNRANVYETSWTDGLTAVWTAASTTATLLLFVDNPYNYNDVTTCVDNCVVEEVPYTTSYVRYDNPIVLSNPTNEFAQAMYFNAAFSATATLSSNMNSISSSNITATGCAISPLTANGLVYSFIVTPSASTFSYAISGPNKQGNTETTSTGMMYFKSGGFTITLSNPTDQEAALGYYTSAIQASATFSNDPRSFAASNFSTSNCSITGLTGSGTSYSFTVSPTSNGSFGYSVSVRDLYGNSYETSTGTLYFKDSAGSLTVSNPENPGAQSGYYSSSIMASLTCSSPVFLSLSDFSVTNCSISLLTGSGGSFAYTVTPTYASFSYSITTKDYYGYSVSYETGTLYYDGAAVTSSLANPTNVNAVAGYFNGSYVALLTTSKVITLNNSHIVGTGCSIGPVNASLNSYSFLVTPFDASFSYSISGAYDLYGNELIKSSGALFYSSDPPVITGSNPTNANAEDRHFNAKFAATLTFSRTLQTLSLSNISFIGCDVSIVASSGSGMTLDVQPALSTFNYSVSSAYDLYGNSTTYFTGNLFFNNSSPSITLDNPTSPNAASGYYNAPFDAYLTHSSGLRPLIGSNLSTTNCIVTNFGSQNSTTYTYTVGPTSSTFSYSLAVYDLYGNFASADSGALNFSSVSPVVAADNPTNAHALAGYFNAPFDASLTFSKAVQNLTLSNIDRTGCSVSILSSSEFGLNIQVRPEAPLFSYSLTSAYDLYGITVQYDTGNFYFNNTAPVITLDNPTNQFAVPGYYNASFGATLSSTNKLQDLNLSMLTANNCAVTNFGSQGDTYTYTITPTSGSFSYSLPSAYDLYGNSGSANSGTLLFDNTAPSVSMSFTTYTGSTIGSGSAFFENASNGMSPLFTVTSVKTIKLQSADVSLPAGATLSSLDPGTGYSTSFTFRVILGSVNTNGAVYVAGTYRDMYGNAGSQGSTITIRWYLPIALTPTITTLYTDTMVYTTSIQNVYGTYNLYTIAVTSDPGTDYNVNAVSPIQSNIASSTSSVVSTLTLSYGSLLSPGSGTAIVSNGGYYVVIGIIDSDGRRAFVTAKQRTPIVYTYVSNAAQILTLTRSGEMEVALWGATGGTSPNNRVVGTGNGGYTRVKFSANSGTQIALYVPRRGATAPSIRIGAGGGGAAGVRVGGTAGITYAVAGGSGGQGGRSGSTQYGGNGGGSSGQTPGNFAAPGTQSAGGAAGDSNASAGSSLQGGQGSSQGFSTGTAPWSQTGFGWGIGQGGYGGNYSGTSNQGGGGGGGGYFGGGGGQGLGNGFGGGGGSGYVDTTRCTDYETGAHTADKFYKPSWTFGKYVVAGTNNTSNSTDGLIVVVPPF